MRGDFALRPPEVDVLYPRAHHDRVLADGTTLFSKPSGWKELGREKIVIPAAPGLAGDAPWYWRCVPVW